MRMNQAGILIVLILLSLINELQSFKAPYVCTRLLMTITCNKRVARTNGRRFKRDNSLFASDEGDEGVQTDDSTSSSYFPPEILFFGEPRAPPPIGMLTKPFYHRDLLHWARHATVAPRSSHDRLTTVFPHGKTHPQADHYRLDKQKLTYEKIYESFLDVHLDLEATKHFLDANADVFSPNMFALALSAVKLSAQFDNDIPRMKALNAVRDRFILAYDQLCFPLNIEIRKAETRVMTFVGRAEMRPYARDWDAVEMSLLFTTLMTSRLSWQQRARAALQDIDFTVGKTIPFLRDSVRQQLFEEEFHSPGETFEMYHNASIHIQSDMPELYDRVYPEVKLLHEAMTLATTADIKRYVETEFLPREQIALEELQYRLKLYMRLLEGIEGETYDVLLAKVKELYTAIWGAAVLAQEEQWYHDFNGYDFETYEPDTVHPFLSIEQRHTGNIFADFAKKLFRKNGPAFNGDRPKAAEVGDWLKRDIIWNTPLAFNERAKMVAFRDAFSLQTTARKEHEAKLGIHIVNNPLEEHERIVFAEDFLVETNEEEEDEEFDMSDLPR